MNKRQVRRKAKEYAAALLFGQDEPEWAEDYGVPRELMPIFMDELKRIGLRILGGCIDSSNSGEKESAQIERRKWERQHCIDASMDTIESEAVFLSDGWMDISTAYEYAYDGEVNYLDGLGLIERHPDNQSLIRFREGG